jgi:flagellum-specific peptidoglycan hydrolase FlgJ
MPSIVSSYGASRYGKSTVNRQELLQYAEQFLGRPYKWGGEDMWNGVDCSAFAQGVYAHFGYQLPRTSSEQSYTGERIDAANALPGDLVFYAKDGEVYHVMIYYGNGKAIQAQSEATGIVIADIDYSKVCWACRILPETTTTSTQAIDLVEQGRLASAGNHEAQETIIQALVTASENVWDEYGYPRSVLIAQTIRESNWISFEDEGVGGINPQDNNILGMNEELMNDEWDSPWTGDAVQRLVPIVEDGEIVYGEELMRTYDDIESCIEDYAAFKIGMHPELEGETDIDIVIEESLQGYATDPDYQSSIKRIINEYDLTQYDVAVVSGRTGAINGIDYSQEQLELIWAIVAQEDDMSYEGALAVITTAMNRADQNYGGHGMDALSQLTADGQFCYSASVSDPIYYQRRLNGNVPEYVKQAVSDCLERGVRNHTYTNFRSSNRTGNYTQIGGNWYF